MLFQTHRLLGATLRRPLTSPLAAPRRSRSALLLFSVCCRQFVATAYPQLKSLSPSFPVLIRESKGAQPRITARYGEDTQPATHRRRPVRPSSARSSPSVRLVPRTTLALWSPLTRPASASALHVSHRFWRGEVDLDVFAVGCGRGAAVSVSDGARQEPAAQR